MKLQVAHEKLEQGGEQDEQLVNDIMSQGLSTIWKIGLLEIESTVREVCQVVLSVNDKVAKRKIGEALEALGKLYKTESKLARKRAGNTNGVPFFAAPMDTNEPKSPKK